MDLTFIPHKALDALLQDVIHRDLVTARRVTLLQILLHERYLSREQLVARAESILGKGCFGGSAWEDVFYRDMRIVKKALSAAGYQLAYSRSAKRPGFYLLGQPAVSAEFAGILSQSIAEVDPAQLQIFQRMPPAERFRLGCTVTDAARNAVAYRIQQRNPGLSRAEANFRAVQGKSRDE